MSTFVCPDCGSEHDVFDTGGGRKLADEFDLQLLGRIPLDPAIRESGEAGEPIVIRDDDRATAFGDLAGDVMDRIGAVRRGSHRKTTADESTIPEP